MNFSGLYHTFGFDQCFRQILILICIPNPSLFLIIKTTTKTPHKSNTHVSFFNTVVTFSEIKLNKQDSYSIMKNKAKFFTAFFVL